MVQLRAIARAGELVLASQGDALAGLDPAGLVRWQVQVPGLLDAAVVGDLVWCAARHERRVARFDLDGAEVDPVIAPAALGPGRWLGSRLAASAAWVGDGAVALRRDGTVALRDFEAAAPVIEGRWLLWRAGAAVMLHSVGELWVTELDVPGSQLVDAATLADGRLIALAIRPRGSAGDLRLVVLGTRAGDVMSRMRLTTPRRVLFAARRAAALVQVERGLEVIDLRFGRAVRQVMLDPGLRDLVVDETLERVAVVGAGGQIEVTTLAELERQFAEREAGRGAVNGYHPPDPVAEAERPVGGPVREGDEAGPPEERAAQEPRAAGAEVPGALDGPARWGAVPEAAAPPPAPVPPVVDREPEPPAPAPAAPATRRYQLPDAPLLGLRPLREWPAATTVEAKAALEARLELLGARLQLMIAEGWDSGRIAHTSQSLPPFAQEVDGILRQTAGLATDRVARASKRCKELDQAVAQADERRAGRLIPLEQVARQFELSPLATAILFVIATPHLRSDYARLYGILANDPSRAMCDEALLVQVVGRGGADAVSRELDRDRPLRRYGLVALADSQPRPFAALTVEPLIVRRISGLPLETDAHAFPRPRPADRDLSDLWLSAPALPAALESLTVVRGAPARIVIRGRAGSGRRSVLAAMATAVRRTLGIIDVSAAPRTPGAIGELLESALRRAAVRGWLPCVEGLDHLIGDDLELRRQLTTLLRDHPDPLALRLLPDTHAPLDPGYTQVDLLALDERARTAVWSDVVARHALPAPAVPELAARYRVGPGTIERVYGEIAAAPPPPDGAGTTLAVDAGIRQHLETRISAVASRVGRLASWADVVLPEDIIDSLVEMTGRVRHRKTVFEEWGYDRSMSTSRGITALFSGGPGTGKTMVAGVIARDLGVDLYRVDVSRITSKWLGETEKNLGNLFDAAEDGQVMLLFDEADSLFAKRTEVRTSVDRYANMEVNYLLQRLDSFEGLAILTSNFGTAIDPAFRRRLSFRVTFPFPDEEMREKLWRSLIPPGVPRAGDIDFAALSRRFKLSGGYIRNASLRAAFLAAEEGVALSHDHLERAVRAEFRELGKLASTGTLD
jgi:hypothetical protein